MACNQCDEDGVGHSPNCVVYLHDKLDRIIELLVEFINEVKERTH